MGNSGVKVYACVISKIKKSDAWLAQKETKIWGLGRACKSGEAWMGARLDDRSPERILKFRNGTVA